MASGLGQIDWSAPWLAPWQPWAERAADRLAAGEPVVQVLNAVADGHCPVRFVDPEARAASEGYESFVARTGTCPTRDCAHDFFNGLAWLGFPKTKRLLNSLHLAFAQPPGVARGVQRDALTLLDENALLLAAPDELWQALLIKDWQALFGPLRPLWSQARLHLFGHALLEKLLTPRKAVTAHVLRVPQGLDSLAALDDWLSGYLKRERLSTGMFAHLPVLGVPGWWAANANPGFYKDPTVFRPLKAKR